MPANIGRLLKYVLRGEIQLLSLFFFFPSNLSVSSFDLGRIAEPLACIESRQCQSVMSCLWEREFMLSTTFGRSWKLKITSSLKHCIAPLEVMAGHNALPKCLGDASWYLPVNYFF